MIGNFKKMFKDVAKLSKIESEKYKYEVEKLIKILSSKGLKITQNGNRLFYGDLSKGCKLCGIGKWQCLYTTNLCTRSCFFCLQIGKPKYDYAWIRTLFHPHKTFFKNSSELAAYLKKWELKGLGISGGEPLLVIDRTLDFINVVRENLDENFYIWLYSNGDLVSKEILKKLKSAGLNEIRFDQFANGYDTNPIKIACKIIDNVSVEIPAIPEDEGKVKRMLLEWKKLGVKYLNLHELMLAKSNLEGMKKRDYKILIDSSKPDFCKFCYPVYGSALAALRVIDFAIDINVKMNINFCSFRYKRCVQGPSIRRHMTKLQKTT